MSYGDHEDAPGPARAELPLRPPAAHRRQHHDLPPGLRRRRPQARPARRASCPSRSPASRRTATTTTSRSMDESADERVPRPRRARPSSRSSRVHFLGGMLEHFPALMCVGNPTVNSYCRMWDTGLLGADLQELGLAEPHHHGARRRRRPLRVPRRRLVLQPVPDASPRCSRPASTACGASSTRARRSRATPTTCCARARTSRRCPTASAPRSTRSPRDEVIRSALPGRLYKVFHHYKRDEWERYLAAVTDWEREEYLEVLP